MAPRQRSGRALDHGRNQIVANESVATIGNDWHNQGAADFGGDGRSDVLWRNDSGQVALWTMDGAQITNNELVATVGDSWHVQGLLDANGDGKSDVLLRHNSGQVVLWTMDGAQITANQSIANLGLDWNIVGTGDFGGDGKDDVLLRNDSGQVASGRWTGRRSSPISRSGRRRTIGTSRRSAITTATAAATCCGAMTAGRSSCGK